MNLDFLACPNSISLASWFSNVLIDTPARFAQSVFVLQPGGTFVVFSDSAAMVSRIDFSFDNPEVLDIKVFDVEFDEGKSMGPVVTRGIVG